LGVNKSQNVGVENCAESGLRAVNTVCVCRDIPICYSGPSL
jgi:hypothetical protein